MLKAFLFCILFVTPSFALAADFSSLRKTGQAQLVEVINPYTLVLSNGQIIRLAGIHYTDYTPQAPGPFALTAHKILKDLLSDGKTIEIYQTRNKDLGRMNRMGHQIAHLYVKDKDLWVQGALLSLGLGMVYTTPRNPDMAAQMLAIEKAARDKQEGIWAEAHVLNAENTPDHMGQFVVVEDVIQAVSMKKNRVYLNFGGNWRTDFTVSIAPEYRRNFTRAQIDPLQWGEKRVRVRGWLEEYNGPLIEISHPEAIEILE